MMDCDHGIFDVADLVHDTHYVSHGFTGREAMEQWLESNDYSVLAPAVEGALNPTVATHLVAHWMDAHEGSVPIIVLLDGEVLGFVVTRREHQRLVGLGALDGDHSEGEWQPWQSLN